MRLEDLQKEILDILRDKWDCQKLIKEFLDDLRGYQQQIIRFLYIHDLIEKWEKRLKE